MVFRSRCLPLGCVFLRPLRVGEPRSRILREQGMLINVESANAKVQLKPKPPRRREAAAVSAFLSICKPVLSDHAAIVTEPPEKYGIGG